MPARTSSWTRGSGRFQICFTRRRRHRARGRVRAALLRRQGRQEAPGPPPQALHAPSEDPGGGRRQAVRRRRLRGERARVSGLPRPSGLRREPGRCDAPVVLAASPVRHRRAPRPGQARARRSRPHEALLRGGRGVHGGHQARRRDAPQARRLLGQPLGRQGEGARGREEGGEEGPARASSEAARASHGSLHRSRDGRLRGGRRGRLREAE